METIHELRKAIKPLGFTVKTQTFSHGQHAIYEHIATKQQLSFNVTDEETLAKWRPLIDWISKHKEELAALKGETGLYGLVSKNLTELATFPGAKK